MAGTTESGPALRERTVAWEDPAVSARRGLELSGLEYIRGILAGEIAQPPMAALLGFELSEVEERRVVFTARPGEHHYNPMNTVHGGLALTMLDSAMGAAVHTTLMRGQLYSTLESKVNLVRPITADTGAILAEGRVLHRGGSTATAEATLRAADGDTLLAHGTSTCLLLGGDSR
jgi:uncharacterized protein (TIGR00369 family)